MSKADGKVQPLPIPGLEEADTKAKEVQARLEGLQQRIAEAKRAREAAEKRRQELVTATAAGNNVSPEEVARLAATTQAASAQEALLAEAIPGVERELREAQAEVKAALWGAVGARRQAAQEALDEAQAGIMRAHAHRNKCGEERAAWDRLVSAPRGFLERILRDPRPLQEQDLAAQEGDLAT